MRLPVCTFDVRSGTLCPRCEPLLRSGVIDWTDLSVMRELIDLERQFPQLSEAEYVKTIRTGSIFFVLLRSRHHLSSQVKTQLERALTKKLGGPVNVVEYLGDVNQLLEQLVKPARITSISRTWLPDGTEKLVVKVDRILSVALGVNNVAELVRSLKGLDVEIVESAR
jgi:transcription antitermination factor NusA-like protein